MSSRKVDNPEKTSEPDFSRRNLLKAGTLGVTALAASSFTNAAKARSDGIGVVEHDDLPFKVDPDVYKRFKEKNTTFSVNFQKCGHYNADKKADNSRPGFTQVDLALERAGWSLNHHMAEGLVCSEGVPPIARPAPGTERYKFPNAQTALAQIKRAARLMGADVVGITRRDERWDYESFSHYDENGNPVEVTWDEAVDFEPKTVIVFGFDMDYEGLTAAPSLTADGAVGAGYSEQSKTAFQMAVFMNALGYNAMAAGNGAGLSVPYGIMAGLGEQSRTGLLLNYKYGSRLRLSKVYTDLELEEYDKPITFGVESFCENCMRCADSCPSNSVSHDIKKSMAPKNPDIHNNPGVEKWYVDVAKCHQYWYESGTDCGTCLTACPYNKPDFWHHRLIDKLNTILPGPVHKIMAEMDEWHGYGSTFNERAPEVFWGDKGREYDGRMK